MCRSVGFSPRRASDANGGTRAKARATGHTYLPAVHVWRCNCETVLVFAVSAIIGLAVVVVSLAGRIAAADDDGDLVGTIVGLVSDKDKDIRALGLQQVREAAKGAKATRQFAALLPKLPPDAQIGLLDALADRGDKAARPAVLELLKSHDEQVHDASLHALGSLGEAPDIPLMVKSLSAPAAPEQAVARASLTHLPGQAIDAAVAGELKGATPKIRAELIEILAARRAIGTVPDLLAAAGDSDAMVRKAAMAALGQLASASDVAGMLNGVLKAAPGIEREGAERAVLLVCNRIEDPAKRAVPVLAVWSKFSEDEKTALLPTLGRVGNADALKIDEAAIPDKDPRRSQAGIRAICLVARCHGCPAVAGAFSIIRQSRATSLAVASR